MKDTKRIFTVKGHDQKSAIELLTEKTDFSKSQLKKFFQNGAVWLNVNKKQSVLRKVTKTINDNDKVKLYFDPNIKEFDMSQVRCIHDTHHWGIWYKPAGLLSQGTKYGDQFSIFRHVEKQVGKTPFLIHRLDRETSGLMIFAYSKKAAAGLSEQIRKREIRKFYQARVHGKLEGHGEINTEIDGKEAKTIYHALKNENLYTFVEAEIVTGRKHQIRIHLSEIGHPVQGDYRYSKNEKVKSDLKLIASKLILKDPFRKQELTFEVPESLALIKQD